MLGSERWGVADVECWVLSVVYFCVTGYALGVPCLLLRVDRNMLGVACWVLRFGCLVLGLGFWV